MRCMPCGIESELLSMKIRDTNADGLEVDDCTEGGETWDKSGSTHVIFGAVLELKQYCQPLQVF